MKSLLLLAATMMLSLSVQAQEFSIGDRNDWDRGDRGGWEHDGGGWRPGGPGRPGPGRPGPGRPWPGDREETRVIRCESNDHRPASCGVGGQILNARISRQLSNASCNPGTTWGYDRDYIWVQNGCRAEFVVTIRSGGRPGPGPGPRPPRYESIHCGSKNYRFASCAANGFIDYIEVQRQHSGSACVMGQSYGYNNQSIWVDRGCEATFRVYYR